MIRVPGFGSREKSFLQHKWDLAAETQQKESHAICHIAEVLARSTSECDFRLPFNISVRIFIHAKSLMSSPLSPFSLAQVRHYH